MTDRTLSRRSVIALLGGGAVVAAGTGAAAFAATRTPHEALAPWDVPATPDDPRRFALSHALLAPNAHNRQPWLADLRDDGVVRVYRDTTKDLPETDPFGRQLTISMGCFLETMRIAAAQAGHGVETDLFPAAPDGPLEHVATARFVPGAGAPDPLFAAILDRRSCKEPFTDRSVSDADAAMLAEHAAILTDPATVARIRDLTWAAWQVEAYTPRTNAESVDLMRIGRREIEAQPDGIDLGGPFLETMSVVGLLTREAQKDTDSIGFQSGVSMYDEMLHATPAYAVVTTAGNDRTDWIEAGRRWVRLNLATTLGGLSLHPVSQALQEYPEMRDHYETAHRMLAGEGETVQMLGRLGYGPAVPRTPRWPLDAKVLDA